MLAQLSCRKPRCIGGAHERAHARPRHSVRPDAKLVESFQYRDVGKPPRSAAAQRYADPRRAHALTPSANSQALAAIGLTCRAMSSAWGLAAVPSLTRPAIP